MWICRYCGVRVPEECSSCCGETGHTEEVDEDEYYEEEPTEEPTEEQKYRDYVETYGHNTTTMRIGNLNNWR